MGCNQHVHVLSVRQDAASAQVDAKLLKDLQTGHPASVDVPLEFNARILSRAASKAAALVQTNQPAGFQSYAPQSGMLPCLKTVLICVQMNVLDYGT